MSFGRKYPIWIDVDAPDYRSSKSFGAMESVQQTINVGASRTNSAELASMRTVTYTKGEYRVFKLLARYDEGGWRTLTTKWYHEESKTFYDYDPAPQLFDLPGL